MEQTGAEATIILHNDSPHTHKRIFGGQLLRACLEVSWLSVLELCEISQKGSVDTDGNPVEVLNCAKNSEKLSIDSIDVCNFQTPLWLGQILILKS